MGFFLRFADALDGTEVYGYDMSHATTVLQIFLTASQPVLASSFASSLQFLFKKYTDALFAKVASETQQIVNKNTNLMLCGLKMHSDKSHQPLCASSGVFRKFAKMISEDKFERRSESCDSVKKCRDFRTMLCVSTHELCDATFWAMMRLLPVTRTVFELIGYIFSKSKKSSPRASRSLESFPEG